MQDESPNEVGAPDEERTVMQRRRHLWRQFKCPNCGVGRMPESRYCIRCGVELPEITRLESAEEIEQKKPSRRVLAWFVDLVPGAFSPKVLGAAAGMSAAALVLGLVAFRFVFPRCLANPFAAVFFLPLFTLLGGIGLIIFVCGLSWLLCGEVCHLWDAFSDFRVKHWLVFLALIVLGVRMFFWIR